MKDSGPADALLAPEALLKERTLHMGGPPALSASSSPARGGQACLSQNRESLDLLTLPKSRLGTFSYGGVCCMAIQSK